jgi:hypothetical protein
MVYFRLHILEWQRGEWIFVVLFYKSNPCTFVVESTQKDHWFLPNSYFLSCAIFPYVKYRLPNNISCGHHVLFIY